MFTAPFPERIDPRKLFTKNGTVSGVIPLGKLQRLNQYLSSKNSEVQASISFGRDASNRRLVSGPISAEVKMLCQRCLKETVVSLKSNLKVVVLSEKQWTDEVLATLAEDVEAVKATDEELDVHALIEDELILSLPAVAYHKGNDCNTEFNKLKSLNEEPQLNKEDNAFASLLSLKKELSKNKQG